jgi:hypothetical protein
MDLTLYTLSLKGNIKKAPEKNHSIEQRNIKIAAKVKIAPYNFLQA